MKTTRAQTEVRITANHRHLLAIGGVLLVTTAVYWQVGAHEFINFDDPSYLTENPHVQEGLTAEAVKWAFTATTAANWHPLTWLSHMLDCQLFDLNAGRHHIVSLFGHLVNTLLLFFIFKRLTKSPWASVFIAAVFALHPVHVESVAWAAERKDILSTLLGLLTMYSYVRYCEKTGPARYGLVVLFFALGLMAKPMLVTLPFVLLLLDYWPLRRLDMADSVGKGGFRPALFLIVEKIPLLILSIMSCIVTLIVQQSSGAVNPIPPTVRMANAVVSLAAYIARTFWPVNLALPYPHGYNIQINPLLASASLLIVILAVCTALAKRRPYLLVGWFWYLGMLVPVIGLVQVGGQAMADRYMYMPMVGLSVMVAYTCRDLTAARRSRMLLVSAAAIAVLSALAICTYCQVRYWRNSITLFEHAISVTKDNHRAHNNLGMALARAGRTDEAIKHFRELIRLGFASSRTYGNLGLALARAGRTDEALKHCREVIRLGFASFRTYGNLANMLTKKGLAAEAIENYRKALDMQPDSWELHYNLGMAFLKQGKTAEGVDHLRRAVSLNPTDSPEKQELQKTLDKIHRRNSD